MTQPCAHPAGNRHWVIGVSTKDGHLQFEFNIQRKKSQQSKENKQRMNNNENVTF